MENAIKIAKQENLTKLICLLLLGSGLITLGSLLRIPCYPVPFTLQTLALFIVGLTQTPRIAMGSALCYLLWGTLGLPVFAGHPNPLWLSGPCAGYLIAFPLATYLISRISQSCHPFIAILCGQMIIYLIGFLWLIPFVGLTNAWMKEVVFFLPSGLLKNFLAFMMTNLWNKWRRS